MGLSLKNLEMLIRETLAPVTFSTEQARAETGYILEYILNCSSSVVLSHPEDPVDPEALAKIEALLARRVHERIPVQYLVSRGYFYGLSLHVTPDVLIPRPETELLVDEALRIGRERGCRRFLDLGTGSGAIPLALASQLTETDAIVSVEISEAALAVARQNAQNLGLSHRVDLRLGNLFGPVTGETFDIILSNPPYIGPDELDSLAPEVRLHEPGIALSAPEGATFFYERIAQSASAFLNPGGTVLVELGQGLAPRVAEIFGDAGFNAISILPDYAGIDRVLRAS